ncbi:hypothetical protein At1D132_49660 (plasmid) [Agrobacterium fabrum]|nr:hypothetical protein At1D132_49660 [Agrobacterium fabrum]
MCCFRVKHDAKSSSRFNLDGLISYHSESRSANDSVDHSRRAQFLHEICSADKRAFCARLDKPDRFRSNAKDQLRTRRGLRGRRAEIHSVPATINESSIIGDHALQQIHGRSAYKGRNKAGGRAMVYLLWSSNLLYLPTIHNNNPVGQRHGFMLIVCHENRCCKQLLMKPSNFSPHHDPELGIEVRQRFVEQKYFRFPNDGSSHRYTLALTAGKRSRLPIKICG